MLQCLSTNRPRRCAISIRTRIADTIYRIITGRPAGLATITAKVDDSPGWQSYSAAPHDRDAAEVQQLYRDALEAWRKNPLAKRIVDITTDYTVADGITLEAPGDIGRFVNRWWSHPKNMLDLRLPALCDELTRAGDLFLSLHRNDNDGISYIRPIPKDKIIRIHTAENDWETELAFSEVQDTGEPRLWLSPAHPEANDATAIMIHYAINRPVGALLGESDLATILPWLRRYSRMLEDRVRLNWAVRAFLWMVTVPSNKVQAKKSQYATAPEAGSIIVKDESETWEPVTPSLRARDAASDLKAVRRMIDAGPGFPPHWRGEPEDTNYATAKAMHDAANRHLRRRQLYLRYMLIDLAHHSYGRAHQKGGYRARPDRDKITALLPDISREDNAMLATAAKDLAQAYSALRQEITPSGPIETFSRIMLSIVSKFAGEPLAADDIDAILQEAADLAASTPAPTPPTDEGEGQGQPAP